jgi:heme exporter protein A
MIEIHGLTKSFGRQSSLKEVDLDVARGEFLAIVGPTMSGKTTLMRILATLASPTEGQVVIGGYDLTSQPAAVRRLVGFVSHQPLLYESLTAEENLRLYARLYAVRDAGAQISTILSWVGLTAHRNALVRTFSEEMKQQLAIVRALLHEPPLLLLDEPFAGLGSEASGILQKILAVLHHAKSTILMTSRDIDGELVSADRVVMLSGGRIVDRIPIRGVAGIGLRRPEERILEAWGASYRP